MFIYFPGNQSVIQLLVDLEANLCVKGPDNKNPFQTPSGNFIFNQYFKYVLSQIKIL